MVAERELGYAARADRVVERAAPHLCAQRAGVILLAHVENYLLDVGFKAGVGNVQLLAHLAHGREVHALKAQLYRDRLKLKMLGIVALQMLERQQKQHAVLAAGNADGDLVAFVYHTVIVYGLANNARKFVK